MTLATNLELIQVDQLRQNSVSLCVANEINLKDDKSIVYHPNSKNIINKNFNHIADLDSISHGRVRSTLILITIGTKLIQKQAAR